MVLQNPTTASILIENVYENLVTLQSSFRNLEIKSEELAKIWNITPQF